MLHLVTMMSLLLISQPRRPDDALRAICTAYEGNRAAIRFGTIRATLSVGTASDLEAATSGKLESKAVAKCYYVFDGPDGYYEQLHALEDMCAFRTVLSRTQQSSPLFSVKVLTDGKVTLYDTIAPDIAGARLMHTAQITPGVQEFYKHTMFVPINLGDPHPRGDFRGLLEEIIKRPSEFSVDSFGEDVRTVKRSTVYIKVRDKNTMTEYWVDMDQGALPVRQMTEVSVPDGSGHSQTVRTLVLLEDLRDVGGHSWLPYRARVFTTQGVGGTVVRDFWIKEAEFNTRPKRSEFVLELPEPQAMIDQARSARYDPQRVWSLSKLPRAGQRGHRPIVLGGGAPAAPVMPEVISPLQWWAVPSMVIGCLVLVLSVVLIGRQRWRRASDTSS